MLVAPATFHRLCRARDMLSDADESPTIRAIARAVRISPFHFIRQFEALFGATPHQFRIASRIDRAKQLLAREASVTETCMEVGFSSVGTFSDLFRRRVGTSPSKFRERSIAMVQVPHAISRSPHDCFAALALLPSEAFRNFREA
jgi:AraC-like DNA-binding protein